MKRSLALSTGSALVATAVGVTGFLVSGASAGAQSTTRVDTQVAAAGSGKFVVCHQGFGKHRALNTSFGWEGLESGHATSSTSTDYFRARGCKTQASGIEERSRFTAFFKAKPPYRLKSVSVQQTDGTKVTFTHNSRGLRVVMGPGDEVTVTYRWVRPKRR
ncbi:hypothetical protein GCM10009547_35340 [Sporichthya brevicatena]|uniref:Uncharacterized protein n=1 Tax=Sporichthya brevicatena TaxID=171442 RepID=A0ABN1H494_9ACTN